MNKNAYEIDNYSNWIFASNKPDPVTVSASDRRFNIGPYQSVEFPRPSDAEVDNIAGELQAFYHYLESYAVDKLAASTPLVSAARNNLIQLSLTTAESTAAALTIGDMGFFLDQLPTDDTYKLDPKQLAASRPTAARSVMSSHVPSTTARATSSVMNCSSSSTTPSVA